MPGYVSKARAFQTELLRFLMLKGDYTKKKKKRNKIRLSIRKRVYCN